MGEESETVEREARERLRRGRYRVRDIEKRGRYSEGMRRGREKETMREERGKQ